MPPKKAAPKKKAPAKKVAKKAAPKAPAKKKAAPAKRKAPAKKKAAPKKKPVAKKVPANKKAAPKKKPAAKKAPAKKKASPKKAPAKKKEAPKKSSPKKKAPAAKTSTAQRASPTKEQKGSKPASPEKADNKKEDEIVYNENTWSTCKKGVHVSKRASDCRQCRSEPQDADKNEGGADKDLFSAAAKLFSGAAPFSGSSNPVPWSGAAPQTDREEGDDAQPKPAVTSSGSSPKHVQIEVDTGAHTHNEDDGEYDRHTMASPQAETAISPVKQSPKCKAAEPEAEADAVPAQAGHVGFVATANEEVPPAHEDDEAMTAP